MAKGRLIVLPHGVNPPQEVPSRERLGPPRIQRMSICSKCKKPYMDDEVGLICKLCKIKVLRALGCSRAAVARGLRGELRDDDIKLDTPDGNLPKGVIRARSTTKPVEKIVVRRKVIGEA